MAAEKKPQVPKQLEAGQSDSEASLQAAQQEDRELRQGVDFARLITQAVSEAMRPVNEGLQAAVNVIGQRIASIENQLIAQTPVAAPSPSPPPLAEQARQVTDSLILNARREEIWRAETNQKGPLRLPRPTILGRAIRDAAIPGLLAEIAASKRGIFLLIKQRGPHHLPENVAQLIDRKGKTAASRIDKLFKARYQRLVKALLAEVDIQGFTLTRHGSKLFTNWPDWEVTDDDEDCEGVLALAAPREPALNTEAAAGGSDGGNRSGSEGLNSSTVSQPSLLRPGGSGQP